MSETEVTLTPAKSTNTAAIMSKSSEENSDRAQAGKPKNLIGLPAELKKIIVEEVMKKEGWYAHPIYAESAMDSPYIYGFRKISLMAPLCKGMGMEVFAQEYLYNHAPAWIDTHKGDRLEFPPGHVLNFVHNVVFHSSPFKENWPALAKLAVSDDEEPKFPNLKVLKIWISVINDEEKLSVNRVCEMIEEMKEHPLKFKTNKFIIEFQSYHASADPQGQRTDRRAVPARFRRCAEQLFESVSIATNKAVVRKPTEAGKMSIQQGRDMTTARVVLETV